MLRGAHGYTCLQCATNDPRFQMFQPRNDVVIRMGILKRLGTLSWNMANDGPKTATTVRTRLNAEEMRRLKAYADRMGLPGISTALRSLAFENLSLKEASAATEMQRKKTAEEAVRRQLGGN